MSVRPHRVWFSAMATVFGFCLTAQLMGCSRGEKIPSTYPVSGTVVYKDQPVEGATVVFRMQDGDKTRVATGMTDAQGKFQLSTFGDKDGAVEGSHTVTVTKMKSSGQAPKSLTMEEAAEQKDTPAPTATSELPTKYSDLSQTDLKADVKASESNDVKLELKD